LKSKVKWLFLVALLLGTLVLVSGCVSGLAPIGWSGGTVADGMLYIGSEQGRLVAIALADDSRQWSDAIQRVSSPGLFGCASPATGGGCGTSSAGVPIYGNPVVAGDLVYIAGYNGKIYAYNTAALAPRWVYPREGYLEPFVSGLVESGGRLFVGGADGHVYALDAATGDRLWDFPTGDKVWATATVDGNTLYIGSFDKTIYALDTADGREKWHYTTEGAIMATPLVDGGTVYIGSFDRKLYALNAADGSLKWSFQGENWFWARPVVSGGSVYAACLDGKIHVLRAENGSAVTSFDVGDGVSADPVVVDGKIIFVTREGEVYSVDTASNQLDLLVSIDGQAYGPVTASSGVVYIHLQDMTLQRVNIATGSLLPAIILTRPE
jgi:eukaryotic-like serine/threonine-protein kinase